MRRMQTTIGYRHQSDRLQHPRRARQRHQCGRFAAAGPAGYAGPSRPDADARAPAEVPRASAQAAAAKIAQDNANFRAQWQTDANNRQIMRNFQARLERNTGIERSANKERVIAENFLDVDFQNKKGTLSKESATVNAAFLSTLNVRNLSNTSGTARAILRQNLSSMQSNMIALKTNYTSSLRDVETNYNNRLQGRDFNFQEQTMFIPSMGGIADTSGSALTSGLIQAGISGASAGYAGQLQYGAEGTWLH